MKINFEGSVVVITPTVGQDTLPQCINSVAKQTYKNIKHLVVIDGPEYWSKTMGLPLVSHDDSVLQITTNPENTGNVNGERYWGHRVFAAYPHLVNQKYVFFLDEDNWYEPNHVETLVRCMEQKNFDWAYSLRNIYTEDGSFLDPDCCESLGRWPVFWSINKNPTEHLVDSSAYAFKREFLIQVCQHWHSGWGGDRRFYKILTEMLGHKNFGTTGLHTMNYRLDGDVIKKYGSPDFFKQGNKVVLEANRGHYPWLV